MIQRFFLIFIFSCCFAEEALFDDEVKTRSSIPKSIRSYMLPKNHPIKEKVDAIFKRSSRVLEDMHTLKKAGFQNPSRRKKRHAVVATHPSLPGYIFKLYTYDQEVKNGWERLGDRIRGVRAIEAYIAAHGKGGIFKTPGKWIYAVPGSSSQTLKNLILVEERMDVDLLNFQKWKDPAYMTKDLLKEVYAVTTAVGYNDGLSPDNLAFCRDGRLAFIDTERVGKWPVRYGTLVNYLPAELQDYWLQLAKGA